jgi:hypothetical protein
MEENVAHHHDATSDQPTDTKQEKYQLKAVFDNYFTLKVALVKSDGTMASSKAKELLHALNAVQINQLSNEEHIV